MLASIGLIGQKEEATYIEDRCAKLTVLLPVELVGEACDASLDRLDDFVH